MDKLEQLLYYLFAVAIGMGAIAVCVTVLFFPIWLLVSVLGKGSVAYQARSVKDEVVDAQWEYDRKWRRR